MRKTWTLTVFAASLGLGLALPQIGCDANRTSTESAAVTTTQQDAAPAATEPAPPEPPPGAPKPCTADADCAGACPTGSAGCACLAGCGGASMCLSTCVVDADCPSGAGLPPLACRDGACRPARPPGPHGPPPCTSDTDCATGCPAGEQGCTCRALPNDGPNVCMLKCAAAADCKAPPHAPPGAPPAACQDGVCVPPGPPPGAPHVGRGRHGRGPHGPPPCAADADCASRCPPGAQGCACRALPNGGRSVCMLTCTAATDCKAPPHAPPGAPPAACQDGVCVPPGPPPGAPPCGPGPFGPPPGPPPQ